MARPTEVKLVAALLEQEAEDVEELAKRVIQALDADRAKRPVYVLKTDLDDAGILGIGPYNTPHQALLAGRKILGTDKDDRIKGATHLLFPPHMLEEKIVEVGPTTCEECDHPLVCHDWPKKKRGCQVAGCMCKR